MRDHEIYGGNIGVFNPRGDCRSVIMGFLTSLTKAFNRALGPFNLRLTTATGHARLLAVAEAETQQTVRVGQRQLLAIEDYTLDLLRLRVDGFDSNSLVKLRIVTDHPLAFESADHRVPRGTRNDNTRHPRFVARCAGHFGRKIVHLDLGCAGGGLVWDFLLGGNQSYGVEGSDFSLVNQRAMWRVIPNNLFTADITKPFYFVDEEGTRRRFDVITAWEVLEHIPRAALAGFFANLRGNLADDGLFAASIATFPDQDARAGAVWHVTVEPSSWWAEQFRTAGFEPVEGLFSPYDFARGSGNPRADDWDAVVRPDLGFHVVLRKRS